MSAQMTTQSVIALDKERKLNVLEHKITVMVEETEAREHLLFGELNSGLTNM